MIKFLNLLKTHWVYSIKTFYYFFNSNYPKLFYKLPNSINAFSTLCSKSSTLCLQNKMNIKVIIKNNNLFLNFNWSNIINLIFVLSFIINVFQSIMNWEPTIIFLFYFFIYITFKTSVFSGIFIFEIRNIVNIMPFVMRSRNMRFKSSDSFFELVQTKPTKLIPHVLILTIQMYR